MWMLSRITMITDTGKDNERGRLITWMTQMGSVSGLFSPALGGFLAVTLGLRAPFIVYGCLAILAILPSFRLVRETDPEMKRANAEGRVREHVPWKEVLLAMRHKQMLAFFCAQFMASFTRGINIDRKSTRLNSSHVSESRMPSSA